jgi:N-acylglucosamine-6-phosphate 2-epimerase
MADCSTIEDAKAALSGGASILGTTLSGYTAATAKSEYLPDLDLVRSFSALDAFVMAEGQFHTPQLAAKAISAGADCVTVGTALTRLEYVTGWFSDAVNDAL